MCLLFSPLVYPRILFIGKSSIFCIQHTVEWSDFSRCLRATPSILSLANSKIMFKFGNTAYKLSYLFRFDVRKLRHFEQPIGFVEDLMNATLPALAFRSDNNGPWSCRIYIFVSVCDIRLI